MYVIGLMIDAPTYLIRIAKPSDSDAVSAVLAASYSSSLTACYDRDTLNRALPFMTKANPALLRSGTYYVAERGPGSLVGWEDGRQRGREAERSLKGKRTSATLPL